MRRPPRSTRTDTLVPTRRSSDLACRRRAPGRRQYPPHPPPSPARACPPETRPPRNPARPVPWGPKRCALLPLPVLLTQVEIGRAHVCTPVTNAPLVCRLLLDNKPRTHSATRNSPSHTTSR